MKGLRILLSLSVALMLVAVSDAGSNSPGEARGKDWATPVKGDGLPNFFKVSGELYRGAQPTARGFTELKKMGVKTIINLRSFHSDRDEVEDSGFSYEHIYMKAWHPEEKEMVRFYKIVTDRGRLPAFVHCMHGSDRTGLMAAFYRVAVQGWTKDKALAEMTRGGFGYHSVFSNLETFFRGLDIGAIKIKAGQEP